MTMSSSFQQCRDSQSVLAEMLKLLGNGGSEALKEAVASLDEVLPADDVLNHMAIAVEIVKSIRETKDSADVLPLLQLMSAYAQQCAEHRRALSQCQALETILEVMDNYKPNVNIQFCCLEVASDLVADDIATLRSFAKGGGLHLIETAMQGHPQDLRIQLRCIKQLASAVNWPTDIRKMSGFVSDRGIALTKQAMILHANDADLQLVGMESLSAFVGSSWEDLAAFASGGGFKLEEEAMQRHPMDARVQTKGIRAIASGLIWSSAICHQADYCPDRALALTRQAMELHLHDVELQRVAVERLAAYLPKHAAGVVRCGGGDLLRAVFTAHYGDSYIRSQCSSLLNSLGEAIPDPPASTLEADGIVATPKVQCSVELTTFSGGC